MDRPRLAHTFRFRVQGASKQRISTASITLHISLPIHPVCEQTFFAHTFSVTNLDGPPARLDNFATPSSQLQLYTWNVETFIGIGKYISDFKKSSSASHRGFIAYKKANLPTRIFWSFPTHILIYVDHQTIHLPEKDLLPLHLSSQ